MKFDVALKDVKIGESISRLERTDRFYGCIICHKPTGWRVDVGPDCPGTPLCSDECLDEMDERAAAPNPFDDK
jgi:hypothetical protein